MTDFVDEHVQSRQHSTIEESMDAINLSLSQTGKYQLISSSKYSK